MKRGQPSRTAEWVALHRAAHHEYDSPPYVHDDPLARRILTEPQRGELMHSSEPFKEPFNENMRAFLVARSRYAEDALARAVAGGIGQYVILGAGLDTFAYRNPHPQLRVFEVDHPDSQEGKRKRLADASIPVPPGVTFAPVDFESQSLDEGLANAGFQREQPAFFCWMGVVYYLTLESFRETLAFIGPQPPGSGLALDYVVLRQELSTKDKQILDDSTRKVASMDEPFQLFFSPEQLRSELERAGFSDIEELGGEAIDARYFAHRPDRLHLHNRMAHLASAWRREP